MSLRLRHLCAALAMVLAATLAVPGAPAAAATADRFGFAYVADPTVPVWTPLPAAYQFGSWAAGPVATGGKVAPGRFLVRFPNIGLGARGNAHVTAVARDGRFCQLVRWGSSGADEIVDVQCFRPGGTPTDTPFTVLWTVSSGVLPAGVGAYASAQVLSNVLAQSYNSAGAPVTVANVGVGIYALRFLAVGTAGTLSGNVQVTAQQPNAQPRRCKILRWGATGPDVLVYVACHDPATGALMNSDFTASFHRERSVYASFGPPKYFGYLATPFVGPTNYSHPLGVGANGFGPTGLGTYTVKFPALHEKSTTAQVTAIGDDPSYCTIQSRWAQFGSDAVLPVSCFSNAGRPQDSEFSSTFSSSV
ncbi:MULTISPECIES: hypothetical protein [unclassified Micromonospora]|uniref:hypothetical protein n=1 Tax=unclassified Micromonospora TaxID=2617518 RepID=UPI0022B687B5|nr:MULTISPECIES: hypothetical protein [unclassified Micromonospora]MCZ7418378.1 hypothetical protein [Verrucosispora sp. WMMA2121]WBB49701.1 hypothetical protein O3597_04225 [Verrucosispora sp. WMMA2044]WBB92087.1 hypothetical protein O7597_03395 [Verrucosispora sp. WMMC514]